MKNYKALIASWLFAAPLLAQPVFHPAPHAVLPNNASSYSFLNSVDFHPQEPIFSVAYTHNNKVLLYKLEENGQPILMQTLAGASAQLRLPQHAVFSPDGQRLVVANWANSSLTVYLRRKNGLFSNRPASSTPFPKELGNAKPHGIAFSPSGEYFAVACGATSDFKTAIALFKSVNNTFKPLKGLTQLTGTPKGICFSPDGTSLLVTFCEPSYLAIFHLKNGQIDPVPQQIVCGAQTMLSRPEDIKLAPDHSYCAISNSDQDSITFYHFDKTTNTITDPAPFASLSAHLSFPHGLAFSPDGNYLAVTQFGKVETTPSGKLVWQPDFPAQEGAIHVYRIEQ